MDKSSLTNYQLIAITIGLILFAGSFSGSASIAFADHVDFGKLVADAVKAKKTKKPIDPCECKGVTELVLEIKDLTAFADITVTDKKGKAIPFSDEGSGKIKITPIAT